MLLVSNIHQFLGFDVEDYFTLVFFHEVAAKTEKYLSDESPKLKHDGPGLLTMAIDDRDERGSLFYVTFKADHRLDRLFFFFSFCSALKLILQVLVEFLL